jgi:hypothetical protein
LRLLPVYLSLRARPVAQLFSGSSGPEVEGSDDALFTRHTFFVFFNGNEVGEALVGVFLISTFFPPLALLIGFDFLGWCYPLNAFTLVGATFSFLCWGCGFLHPLASSSCTR